MIIRCPWRHRKGNDYEKTLLERSNCIPNVQGSLVISDQKNIGTMDGREYGNGLRWHEVGKNLPILDSAWSI